MLYDLLFYLYIQLFYKCVDVICFPFLSAYLALILAILWLLGLAAIVVSAAR